MEEINIIQNLIEAIDISNEEEINFRAIQLIETNQEKIQDIIARLNDQNEPPDELNQNEN